jgi:hypothetical protein
MPPEEVSDEAHVEEVKRRFNTILNEHGYSFQYGVVRVAERLYVEHVTQWFLKVTEFPVEVRGKGTRIDLVLERRRGDVLMLGECKRANPAMWNWCFATSPYVERGDTSGLMIFDRITRESNNKDRPIQIRIGSAQVYGSHDIYHIGVEVKSDRKGNQGGSATGAIEDAATQVLRGLNGMIEHFMRNRPHKSLPSDSVMFLPVIFTTAQLWSSDVKLHEGNLQSGNIDLADASFKRVPWLLYQYHLSPGLKHEREIYEQHNHPPALEHILSSHFSRTIPIVSADGIEEFLKWSSHMEFG